MDLMTQFLIFNTILSICCLSLNIYLRKKYVKRGFTVRFLLPTGIISATPGFNILFTILVLFWWADEAGFLDKEVL